MDLLTDCLEPILSFLKEQLPPPGLLFHHLYDVALSGVLHRILHFGWWARLNESSPMERANSTTPSHCCILSIFRPAESLSDYKLDVAHQLLVYQVGYYCGRPYWASGWVFGHQQLQVNRSGGWTSLGEVAMDMLNNPNVGQSKRKPRTPPQRPRVWETFDRHRAWQERQKEPESRSDFNAKEVIGTIHGGGILRRKLWQMEGTG